MEKFKIELSRDEIKNILNALRGWKKKLYQYYNIDKKKASKNPYVKAYGQYVKLEDFFENVLFGGK